MNKKSLSIIIPVYNAEKFIEQFFEELDVFLNQINTEAQIIFVNDASKDNSLEILEKLKNQNNRNIYIIHTVKNNGQFVTTCLGLEYSNTDYIMTIDCDFSPSPLKLVELWDDLIFDISTVNYFEFDQKKSVFRKVISYLHHQYIRLSTHKKLDSHTGSSCRIFSKKLFQKIENKLNQQPEKLDILLLNNASNVRFIRIEDYKSKNLSTHSIVRLVNYLSKLLFK